MPYTLQDSDKLELWKYFQERADNVKEAMFNSVTWSLGFAAAILGFLLGTQVEFAAFKVAAPGVMIGAATIGLVLCVYAVVLVRESRKHILSNWARADRCRSEIDGLDRILGLDASEKALSGRYSLSHVWNQVLCVIAAFALGFAVLVIWGAASLGG